MTRCAGVLRKRNASTDDRVAWYLAVDDGTAGHVRAGRFQRAVPPGPGQFVTADVMWRLQHVATLAVVPRSDAARSARAPGRPRALAR